MYVIFCIATYAGLTLCLPLATEVCFRRWSLTCRLLRRLPFESPSFCPTLLSKSVCPACARSRDLNTDARVDSSMTSSLSSKTFRCLFVHWLIVHLAHHSRDRTALSTPSLSGYRSTSKVHRQYMARSRSGRHQNKTTKSNWKHKMVSRSTDCLEARCVRKCHSIRKLRELKARLSQALSYPARLSK